MRPPPLEIRLLGPFEVLRHGERQELPPSRKARALLAYLVSTGRPHGRSALCDLFWQDVDDPRAGLRWALSKLRKVVEVREEPSIVSNRGRVGFAPDAAVVDLHRVRAAIPSDDPSQSDTEALREVAGALRGEFVEGLELPGHHGYETWCLGMRERLRTLRLSVHATLADRLQDAPEEAVTHALARLALDPLSEEAHIAAMDRLGAAGRTEQALELYLRGRRTLERELGVPPSAELEAARRRWRGRPPPSSSGAAVPEPPPDPTVAEPPPAPTLAEALAELPEPEHLPAPGGNDPPLVGRGPELEALTRVVLERGAPARVPPDPPPDPPEGEAAPVLLLTGEAGIGKTRLLRELVQSVRGAGGSVLSGPVFETEEVRPYGPWTDLLRELPSPLVASDATQGLAALLHRPAGGPLEDGPTVRAQLFDAVARLLGRLARARPPLLLVLDDVQWLDASSAALLHYVARTLDDAPLAIALAAREEGVGPGSPVAPLVRSLDVDGRLRRVSLDRLDAEETTTLVGIQDEDVDPSEVFARSEGNPLYALAVAASLREGVERIPGGVREELRHRLARLPPDALALLPWAAALGRAFDVPTLVRVAGRPAHEVVGAVDALERRGVVRASGRDGFDFTHSLLRQEAYERSSEPVRREIHRSIARALDRPGEESRERAPGAMAHHAALGGLAALAAGAWAEAAEAALWVFASDEAAVMAERGIAQLEGLPAEERVPLEMRLLRLYTFRGMRDRRPGDLEARVGRVTEEARELGLSHVVARGHAALMELQFQRGALQEAGRSSRRLAETSRKGGPLAASQALAETAACLLLLDQAPDDAERLASEAFQLAERHGEELDVAALARALLSQRQGALDQASEAFREVIRLGKRSKDRWWEIPARTRMVMLELDRGAWADALALAREAEAVAERADDAVEVAFARGLGAVAAARLGGKEGEEQVLEELDRALEELRAFDTLWRIGYVQSYAGELELDRGRPREACARSTEVLEAARALERPSLLALARALLARAATLDGDPARAWEHLAAPEITSPVHPLSHRATEGVARAREAASEGP